MLDQYEIDVPDYVELHFEPDWTRANANAEYLRHVGKKNGVDSVVWDDLVNPDTGKLDIYFNADELFQSRDASLAHVVHELYEVENLHRIMHEKVKAKAVPLTFGLSLIHI